MKKRSAKFNENEFPLVTVVVNHRRRHHVLKMCIDAILTQDYPNIEIVLYDFGTTDDSWRCAVSYQLNYPGIITLLHSRTDFVVEGNAEHFPNIRGRNFVIIDSAIVLHEGAISRAIDAIKGRTACAYVIMGNKSRKERERFYSFDCEMDGLEHLQNHLLAVPYPDSSIVLYGADLAKATQGNDPYLKQAKLCLGNSVVSISSPQFKTLEKDEFETIYPHFISLCYHKLKLIGIIDQLYHFVGIGETIPLIWERFASELINLVKEEVERGSFETALRYYFLAMSQYPQFVAQPWVEEVYDSLVSKRYSSFWQDGFFQFYDLDRFTLKTKSAVPINGK